LRKTRRISAVEMGVFRRGSSPQFRGQGKEKNLREKNLKGFQKNVGVIDQGWGTGEKMGIR